MKVLLDQTIGTDYGQLLLFCGDYLWDGELNSLFGGQLNGWAGAATPGLVHIVLARRSGGSSVRIEFSDEEPPSDASWEDSVEVSLEVPPGPALWWSAWGGLDGGALDISAGSYRLRVSARGRDAGQAGEFDENIVDFYLLQLWPSPVRPDAILRVGSADAAHWHDAWGSRR